MSGRLNESDVKCCSGSQRCVIVVKCSTEYQLFSENSALLTATNDKSIYYSIQK